MLKLCAYSVQLVIFFPKTVIPAHSERQFDWADHRRIRSMTK